MKIWKLIAIIMAIILAGGAVASLIGRGDGSEGRLIAELKEPCTFNVATGTVPAAEDPAGKGYEYFACEECGEMRRVVANHESGHYFRTLSNGEKFCACGAKLDITKQILAKNEFSSRNEDITIFGLNHDYYLGDFDNDSMPDALKISKSQGQFFLRPQDNAILTALLKEDEWKDKISSINFAFDFKYTGTYLPTGEWTGASVIKYVFMNYQYSTSWLFALCLEPVDGKISVYECDTPDHAVTLLPDVEYTFDFLIDPITQRVCVTIEGGALQRTVLFDEIVTYPPFSELFQIAFGRSTFYCSDDSYALYIDNLKIGCSLYTVDEGSVNEENKCDHDFKVKGVVDYDHPASEKWKKYTCKDCKRWYYGH